jgi:hypothetical protein
VESTEQRIARLSVDEVGARYLPAFHAVNDDSERWIVDAVWYGLGSDADGGMVDLPVELHWELVLAALKASPDDDNSLWCIGHQPISQIASQPGMVERIRAERDRNPKMLRVFRLMQEYYDNMALSHGFWAADSTP